MKAIFLATTLAVLGCAQTQNAVRADSPAKATAQQDASGSSRGGNVDLPRFPSISPDGEQVIFSWRGDLWKASVQGGEAIRLTTHPADDLQSAWSPDGSRIAFNSDRNGYLNLYTMNVDGTNVRQVSDIDVTCRLAGFGVDGGGNDTLMFDAFWEGDVYRSPRPFMISLDGGEPRRVHDAFGWHPTVSPDGRRVAFTRGGSDWARRGYRGPDNRNVWIFNRDDGSFQQVTEWTGNDGMARWLGNDKLVFLSDRELDCVNLYVLTLGDDDSKARRLTSFDENDIQDLDVSTDGRVAVFVCWDTIYRLDLTTPGAAATPLAINAAEDERDNYLDKTIDRTVTQAALSPDGKVMAYVAYGEVFVRNVEEKSQTQRVTHSDARESDIAWSPDGLKLYFVSDENGTDSIYFATVTLTRDEVKKAFKEATTPPTPRAENQDEADAATQPAGTDEKAAAASQPTTTQCTATSAPADESDAPDDEAAEDKDEKEPKETKEKDASRWQDAIKFDIAPLIVGTDNDRAPSPSPDGKLLAFRRNLGDLVILDLASNETRRLVAGWDPGLECRWSPDSRLIAYQQSDLNFNTDIWIVPADGASPPINITRHPDNDFSPRWSADGKILAFLSERVNEEYDVWMVYLDPDLEAYTPKELKEYYENAAKEAKKRKPLGADKKKKGKKAKADDDDSGDKTDADKDAKDDVDKSDDAPPALRLDDAYLRLRRVTQLSGNEGNLELTPAADRYIFTAGFDEPGLFSVQWDGKKRKRLGDAASVMGVSLTGDKVIIVNGGRAATVPPDGGKLEFVDISGTMRIDLREQASRKFINMARVLGEQFYHPTMKGLDWPALTAKYHALACKTRRADEFNYVAMRMLGELNASHLGVYSRDPDAPERRQLGRIGTWHRRVAEGYAVTQALPESPAATGPMALQPGDVITAIEFEPFTPQDTLASRLRDRVGKETVLTIRRAKPQPADAAATTQPTAPDDADDGAQGETAVAETTNEKTADGDTADSEPGYDELQVLLTPITGQQEDVLKYKAWRRRNAELVNEWSDGKLGYIHIRGMGQQSLDVFERDLYAAAGDKHGLIVDVRNNGGGWTADRLLSSIMVQPHAYTLPRGGDRARTDAYPQDRLFIQRYTLPIDMMCNEKSFSNAEIVSHAFKTLGRGTLVGQQTYGGVISTGGFTLIDGTYVRLPFRGWFLLDGTDMENHGAVPDIIVPQTPEDESADNDAQLRAAVEDLLKRI